MATALRTPLSQREAQCALAFSAQVGADHPSLGAFATTAVQRLQQWIGAEIVTLSYCDLQAGTRKVITWPHGALGPGDEACFNRYFREHPLVRFHALHREAGAHRISDSWSRARFEHSGLYGDYYRRLGIRSVVAVPVHVDRARLVSFVLNRSTRDFSERDCRLLDAVRFQLAAGYMAQEARERAQHTLAQLRELLAHAGWAVIVLDRERRVLRSSERAMRWLAQAGLAGGVVRGAWLPEPIDRWLRERLANPLALSDPGPLALRAGKVQLKLHLVIDDETLTLLLEGALGDASIDAALAPELTPRERDILRWLGAGKRNAEIAQLLGISPRTVQKHLEHLFDKLGVENRTAAVLRALQLASLH